MIAADMTNLRKVTEAALSGFAPSNKQTLITEEFKALHNGSDNQLNFRTKFGFKGISISKADAENNSSSDHYSLEYEQQSREEESQ